MPKTPGRGAATPSGQTGGQAGGAFTITHYTDKNKRDYFQEWLSNLWDDKAIAAIAKRIGRVAAGNFGDATPVRGAVRELRVDVGPGYRIYYARDGLTVVLLLCGGDKRKQDSDIDRAVGYWRDWQERKKQARKKEDGA